MFILCHGKTAIQSGTKELLMYNVATYSGSSTDFPSITGILKKFKKMSSI